VALITQLCITSSSKYSKDVLFFTGDCTDNERMLLRVRAAKQTLARETILPIMQKLAIRLAWSGRHEAELTNICLVNNGSAGLQLIKRPRVDDQRCICTNPTCVDLERFVAHEGGLSVGRIGTDLMGMIVGNQRKHTSDF
jgi:hypothetical protein